MLDLNSLLLTDYFETLDSLRKVHHPVILYKQEKTEDEASFTLVIRNREYIFSQFNFLNISHFSITTIDRANRLVLLHQYLLFNADYCLRKIF